MIVPGGMSEGTACVYIAQGPHARNVGAQLIVDLNEAARIGGDARRRQTQVLGVGPAPTRLPKRRYICANSKPM